MLKTEDIKELLLKEYESGNYRETGYDCINGNKYVELRNVVFEVNKPYILNSSNLRMNDQWYVDNYEPLINNQLNGLINKISKNPFTRQAILILPRPNIYETDDFPCTIYIHIFLDKINESEYKVEYSVHMRSNDADDFVGDVLWNAKIYNKIIDLLQEKTGWKLYKKNIIWCVDSIQYNFEKYNNLNNENNSNIM